MSDAPFVAPEWAPRAALWTAWPSHADLWLENLEPARAEVAAMIEALAAGERVRVLAANAEAARSARAALPASVDVLEIPFGDIWLRDTGPIFVEADGQRVALGFRFNGWGGKYVLDGDAHVGSAIAAAAGVPHVGLPFVLEGGAIEMDGEGTVLTTRQCLLNPNRNAGWTQADAEEALAGALGAEKVLWLDEGLANDHTDGHIDNLARFVAPGVVVCQSPWTYRGRPDPNAAVLDRIASALEKMTDASGRRLTVVRIPSPGFIEGDDGKAMPASHMNFIIGAKRVIVPIYSDSGDDAIRALAPLFPDRGLMAISANELLSGGGSFHCITQQEPA
jgi:agmatine deiminase